MNKAIIAAFVLTLTEMDNLTIAIGNNGITGFGKVGPISKAYKSFLDAGLICPDGTPQDKEALEAALDIVINQRLKAKTWN